MIMMCQWWVDDESLNIDYHDASMMSRWWIGNESSDELVKIDDASIIGAELVISWCLSEIRFLDTKEEFFPLTYDLNLPSPVTSTRTSVRLF